MSLSILDQNIREYFSREIRECPMCHVVLDPKVIDYIQTDEINWATHLVTFYCKHCGNYFHAFFNLIDDFDGGKHAILLRTYPNVSAKTDFNEKIKEISPVFDKCFQQSIEAEINNLNLIAGMGYRKSLEYLIKDFTIYQNQENEEEIKKMPLKQVIDKYIDNEKIKSLAIAATWIGNDETHYAKKHDGYNLEDLKNFIKIAVLHIEQEFIYEKAVSLISK